MNHPSISRAPEKTAVKRDAGFDNLRFLLIFTVVFAHLLESAAPFPGSALLYEVIYSFHMPAFVFLFGYFAKFSGKRILFHWIVPYLIFQTLYIFFARSIYAYPYALQYTTPYWILWYMLAGIYYQLLIPVYHTQNKFGQLAIVLASTALALAAGFDKTVGYYGSLSRFLVFQPWFILGFYCRQNAVLERLNFTRWSVALKILSAVLVCLSVWYLDGTNHPVQLLYGSYSYESIGCTVWDRLTVMGISLGWICFLFVAVKPLFSRRIPIVTMIGQYTLPVFLLHGFLARAIPAYYPQLLDTPWKVLLISMLILLLFGNRLCKKVIDLACFGWLEKNI